METTNLDIPRYRLSLVRESESGWNNTRAINQASQVEKFLRPYTDTLDREEFIMLALDAKNMPIGWNVVSIGTLTLSLVHPREVFKAALSMNAAAIIAVHNHPSGDPTPSREDLALTKRLKDCGELLGIRLLDHVITGDNGRYVSLADMGEV